MRLPNLVHAAGSAILLVLLSGCAPSGANTPPEPTATFVAPYATDEEALAAAEEAYAEYSRVADQIFIDGGANAERLAEVAVGSFLESSIESSNSQLAAGHTGSGRSSFTDVKLQRYSPLGPVQEILVVYLCEDISQVDVKDSAGDSIVPESRNDTVMLQVTFDFVHDAEELKVSGVEQWRDEPC